MKKYLVLLISLLLAFGCTSFHLHTPDGAMKSKITVSDCEEARECTDEEPQSELDEFERLQRMAEGTAGKFSDYAAQSDANSGANDTLLLYDADDAQEAGKLNQLTLDALDTWLAATTKTLTNKTLTSPTLTTPVISGEATVSDPGGVLLTDDNYIELDATADGMDDDEYNGIVIGGRNCGENVGLHDVVYIHASDADMWHEADATAASGEYPAQGIAIAACTDTNEARILIRGIVRNEGWTGMTPGTAIYLGETDGVIITNGTAPSTTNDCVQIIGFAISDSEILFDFSRPYQLVE